MPSGPLGKIGIIKRGRPGTNAGAAGGGGRTGDGGIAGHIQNGISGDRGIGAGSVFGRLLGTGLGSGVVSAGGSKPGFLGFKGFAGTHFPESGKKSH
jgi:hypothetical protein